MQFYTPPRATTCNQPEPIPIHRTRLAAANICVSLIQESREDQLVRDPEILITAGQSEMNAIWKHQARKQAARAHPLTKLAAERVPSWKQYALALLVLQGLHIIPTESGCERELLHWLQITLRSL